MPDVINFRVSSGEHSIGVELRSIASWFALQLLKKVKLLKEGQHSNAFCSHAVICGHHFGFG